MNELKALDRLCDQLFLIDGNLNKKDKDLIACALNALCVMREKNVDLVNLKACFGFYPSYDEAGLEDYNRTKNKKADELTFEEYTVLRKALMNDAL